MRLVWARLALADRDAIFSYLEQRSPQAAIRIDELIVNAAWRLIKFPEIGRLRVRANWWSWGRPI